MNITFGESLKRFRKEFKISAKETAARMQVSPTMYSAYENNRATPSVALLINLADAYGVSLDYLAGRSNEEEEPQQGSEPADKYDMLAAKVEQIQAALAKNGITI